MTTAFNSKTIYENCEQYYKLQQVLEDIENRVIALLREVKAEDWKKENTRTYITLIELPDELLNPECLRNVCTKLSTDTHDMLWDNREVPKGFVKFSVVENWR
jgi:hypothetical protein